MSKFILILVTILFAMNSADAGEFVLVTQDEFQRSMDAGETYRGGEFNFRSAPGEPGPLVKVYRPKAGKSLFSPVDIKISCIRMEDVPVDVESLEILYGWLEIDVTDRIREYAEITEEGISAPGAKLPSGDHSFLLRIADVNGRLTEKSFDVTVAEAN